MTREILIHLNIEVPESEHASAEELGREVLGALEVGADADETPCLRASTVTVALAEEI